MGFPTFPVGYILDLTWNLENTVWKMSVLLRDVATAEVKRSFFGRVISIILV
jgi:hypothetical protein